MERVGQHQKITPTYRFRSVDVFLANEFAIHYRDSPVSLGADFFGNLFSVTEVSNVRTQGDPTLAGQACKNRCARTSQDALTDPLFELLL